MNGMSLGVKKTLGIMLVESSIIILEKLDTAEEALQGR